MGAFNFDNLGSIHKKEDTIIDPIGIFYNTTHPKIRDLYPIQRDALVKWYENFSGGKKDNLIQLDTGAGKTLVGLFIAESLRKTKKGKILYLCSDNYLVQQTVDKSDLYGLKVSYYFNQEFVNEDLFLSNEAICITNYHAVFNSQKFKELNISGVVFDDSHSSIDILDRKYSIEINKEDNEYVYNKILNIFIKYDELKDDINSIKQNDSTILSIIPPMLWLTNQEYIKNIIEINKDELGNSVKYNFKNISRYFEKSMCFIGAGKIEITTLYPDVSNEFILDNNIDKVFLSATVNNIDDFVRFFDIEPNIISLETLYRPDRLFLFTSIIKSKISNIDEIIIKTYNSYSKKTLILVPAKSYFEQFEKDENTYILEDTASAKAMIDSFKAKDNCTLIVANRYDGIDIDGDSGHFMIIFDILNHSTFKNKFLASRFGDDKNDFLRSNFAGKITQAFGRTTRSSTDYSTIIIMGEKLNSTLLNSDNNILFSRDLVEDLSIGKLISQNIVTHENFLEIIKSNLEQDEGYKSYVTNQRTKIKGKIELPIDLIDEKKKISRFERKIFNYFYENNFNKVIELIGKRDFEELLTKHKLLKLYGYYLTIGTYCYLKIGEIEKAKEIYNRGKGIASFLGENKGFSSISQSEKTLQEQNILKSVFDRTLIFNGDISSSIFEENLKKLGVLLGFQSIRPEKELSGIKLDNLIIDEENKIAIGLECKNEKTTTHLNKDNIGQSYVNFQWMKDNYKGYTLYYYIVGDIKYITENCSVSDEFLCLGFEELNDIYFKISNLYNTKELFPSLISSNLFSLNILGLDSIFNKNRKIKDLPIKKCN